MKGETGTTLLSRPWAALPGFTQQPQARQRWPPPREPFPRPLGKQNFSVFGEYFRNSDEKDLLLLSAPGAERGLLSSSVGEIMGTPERSAFLRMTGPPRDCRPTSLSRPRGARQPPPGGLLAAVTAISYDCH